MQKQYQVLDNNKPADCLNFKVSKSWVNSSFNQFEKAESYALNWLDSYSPGVGVLRPNEPFHYSGYGDYLEIREISAN